MSADEPNDVSLSEAVEGMQAAGAQGSAPAAGADEPHPDRQPR